ncbi:MAG TPA: helicase-related protein, partial [Flavobacteriales bacterium]|nr:helicase-related protein [Flavobacteriales bacterium]
MKRLNAGRGVHLFTGTPITNTMTEIYNMMRYVMDDQMARDGIREWDAWFNTFADSTSDVELTAAGEYEPVTRLAAFVNVSELRRMIGQYMDIVFADDMPEFKPRATAQGRTLGDKDLTEAERLELLNGRTENPIGRPYKKVVADVAEMTPDQQRILARLQEYANRFKNASKKERREIMLAGRPESPVLVETGASNAGLDARLYDMSASDEPTNKVNRAVRRIIEHYNEHPQATQVVFVERGFSDASVSRKKDRETGQVIVTKKERFNLVADMVDKLVAQGVKREEIAIVDGGTSKDKRKAIADAMNRAEIRVVIGNTKTLGVGVNMQVNLRAMHHLDAPWMPGDLEQRNGRGHRQGNKWNTVMEYRYLTERIDGRRWQVLAVKDRFIKAFLKAKDDVRVIEGDAVSMDEEGDIGATLADAAGDPRLLMMNKLKADVLKLENKERMHA